MPETVIPTEPTALSTEPTTAHGIDLTAPGGIEALLAFHFRTFGTATMSIAPAEPVVDPVDPPEPTDPSDPVVDPVDPPEPTEPKTFDEAYVKDLRKEAAGYRDKAKKADAYAARLHEALVKSDGRLQDPTDLAFDAAHVDDPEALTAAIDALLLAKPHLASRRPSGNIPQGPSDEHTVPTLGGLLRGAAR